MILCSFRFSLSILVLAAVAIFPMQAVSQDAYEGLEPKAGDVHQHAGKLRSNLKYAKGSVYHVLGDPIVIYDNHRDAGYDWVLLSHHDHLMTGTEFPSSGDPDAYQWWIDPASQPLYDSANPPNPIALPSPNGLPDYLNGGAVTPGWNEALSLSTAAEARNDPTPEGFLAFSGREYTTPLGGQTSTDPGKGGHKVVAIPTMTDRICGSWNNKGIENYCDETDLYLRIHALGGAIIQAHPGGLPGATMAPWDPVTDRAGLSDLFVHGLEIGRDGVGWEPGYQNGLKNGYKLFPAYGSDRHSYTGINIDRGATICWVPALDYTRANLTQAMRDRRCYFSTANKPVLKYEMRDEATDPYLAMGSELVTTDGEVELRIRVDNDLLNQDGSGSEYRFDLLELIYLPSKTASEVVAFSSSCVRDLGGDYCDVDMTLSLSPGAYYPRVCSLAGSETSCDESAVDNRIVIGAPIFVDWEDYKISQELPVPTDPACDFDGDGLACTEDNCIMTANPDQSDVDGDGVGDSCDQCPGEDDAFAFDIDGDGIPSCQDVCPYEITADQLDSDGDGVGDACDNCPEHSNPDQFDWDRDGYGVPCDPEQDDIDTDGDQIGDPIDNCPGDVNPYQADTDSSGLGDTCNDQFDFDGDEWEDSLDNCPSVSNSDQANTDGGGPGDVCNDDFDLDGDEWDDALDNCPSDPNPDQADIDNDGEGDICDPETIAGDSDGDGIGDSVDNCIGIVNESQCDTDEDGYGNHCDGDFDNNSWVDGFDYVWEFVPDFQAGYDSGTGTDMDCNGSVNSNDFTAYFIPQQVLKRPGASGLSCAGTVPCVDGDLDGVPDHEDNCPLDSNPGQEDQDGDGLGDECDFDITPNSVVLPSIASEDGWIKPPYTIYGGSTFVKVGNIRAGKLYSIFSFDTSGIPDGVDVVKATLWIKKKGVNGQDPFSVPENLGKLAVHNSDTGGFSDNPNLQKSDRTAAATLSNAAEFSGVTPQGNWRGVDLVSDAFDHIKKANGRVQLRFKMSKGAGSGNTAIWHSGNSDLNKQPILVLDYEPAP